MFRVVLPLIIRSAYNCIHSIWYLSRRYCYLPLSWKSWNRFGCAVGGVRHSQHTQTGSNSSQDATLSIHLHLVSRLRKSATVHLYPLHAFMEWTGTSLPFFTFTLNLEQYAIEKLKISFTVTIKL
jgi:hypothetical protein